MDSQFHHQLGNSVPYWNILFRFNELPAGVRQSQEEDTNIFRGAVVSIGGTGATPESRARHAAALDSQDLSWKNNEHRTKCVVLVDNCFVMNF